jgi:hypothetical protein
MLIGVEVLKYYINVVVKGKSYLQSKLSMKVLKCMLTVWGIGIVSVKYTYCGVPRNTSLGTPRIF